MTNDAVPLLIPPHDLEAERAVLGAVLLDPTLISAITDFLSYRHFYQPGHAVIYKAMETMGERDEPIDQVTLSDHLRKIGELETVGGASYLAELLAGAVSTANVKHHCQLIREKAIRRQLGHAGLEIHRRSYDEEQPLEEVLNDAEQEVFRLAHGHVPKTFEAIRSILPQSLEDLDRLYMRQASVTGVPTGFRLIDARTAGWQAGDLIVVGARPSMGKSKPGPRDSTTRSRSRGFGGRDF